MAYVVSTRAAGPAPAAAAQSRSSGGQVQEHVPHLALRPAPELGRIDEDDVVALAAPHLARHELARVLEDPADRRLSEPRDRLVLLGPGDRPLGGVDVRHLGAGVGRNQRGRAGIGEEIEHARAARRAPRPADPASTANAAAARGRGPGGGSSVSRPSTVTPSTLHRPGLRQRLVLAPAPALAVLLAAAALERGVGPQPYARAPAPAATSPAARAGPP